ncbi:MAG TPA: LysM peptidoglycan-binding domain-containing protein [Luteimonas sp.]|nr:LysM peptidoglycan-binding domain-containing protein [Luteimonas sp.]
MSISAVSQRQTLAAQDAQANYTIQRGDTLSAIARQHGVTVSELLAANPQVRNANLIYPGDKLDIPSSGGGGRQTAATADAPAAQPAAATGGKFDYNRIAGVKGNPNVTPAFIREVEAMAARLGTKPEYLMAVMSFETGGSFSPGQKNNAGSGATGLIQFMPGTASGLGTSTSALARMSSVEQLAYVEKYFMQRAGAHNGKLSTLEGVYTTVLYGSPKADPSSTLWSSGSSAYSWNKGLDRNGDGRITAGEAANAVRGRVTGNIDQGGSSIPDKPDKPGDGGTPSKPSGNGGSVTVHAGDTLSGIASRNGVSLSALLAANPQIRNANLIYPGQTIHLPGGGGSGAKSHDVTVHAGDTLSGIAARNGVSLSALINANPQIHNPNLIYAGQTVHVPGGSSGGGGHTAPASHDVTVRSGDTMSGIAARNGVSLSALINANPQVHNPNLIYAGQTIHVPGAGSSTGSGPVDEPSGGNTHGNGNVVSIAEKFLGRNASDLKRSGELPMESWVPNDVNCANFVTAVLQKAGMINWHDNTVAGTARRLKAQGWHVVPASQAKPGDVCILNYGGHVELVASNNNGHIKLIGSNNTNADGSQRVGYGNPYGNAYYLSPP